MNPGSSPPPLDDMLDRMYDEIGRLRARAARAPPTPSGSSVTEPDSDPDKDETGTVGPLICSYYSSQFMIMNSRYPGQTSRRPKQSWTYTSRTWSHSARTTSLFSIYIATSYMPNQLWIRDPSNAFQQGFANLQKQSCFLLLVYAIIWHWR